MNAIKDDNTLLEIEQIKNINSISFKNIYTSLDDKSTTIIPGFIITYGDNNKMLFLTSYDKYFEEYVRKIKEVYLEEKNHVLNFGIRGKEYIEIDSLSKHMLLNGNLDNVSELYDEYQDKENYQDSLLFEKDKLEIKMPMIEYHLKETLKKLDLTVININLSDGMNGVYYLSAFIDNMPVILPFYCVEEDDNLYLTIGNIFENAIPLHIDIFYKYDGMHVHSYISEYGFSDYNSYLCRKKKIIAEREVSLLGKIIHYNKQELKEEKNMPVKDFIGNDLLWYKLPWPAYLGTSFKEEGMTDKIVTEEICYVGMNELSFYSKQMINKYYKKIEDDRTSSNIILLDNMNKSITGLYDDETYIIETHFTKDGVSGFYKGHLAGNYFYQVCSSNLTKDNAIFLKKDDGLIEPCNLLKPKKYIRK